MPPSLSVNENTHYYYFFYHYLLFKMRTSNISNIYDKYLETGLLMMTVSKNFGMLRMTL